LEEQRLAKREQEREVGFLRKIRKHGETATAAYDEVQQPSERGINSRTLRKTGEKNLQKGGGKDQPTPEKRYR